MKDITLGLDIGDGFECDFTISKVTRAQEEYYNGEWSFTRDIIEGEVFITKEDDVLHSGTKVMIEISEGKAASMSDCEQLSNFDSPLSDDIFDSIFMECLGYGTGILIEELT